MNERLSFAPNRMGKPGGIGYSHNQEYKSEDDAPGRAKDEVARSRAYDTPETDEPPIDLPKQVTREANLEAPNISLGDTIRWGTYLYDCEENGEDHDY